MAPLAASKTLVSVQTKGTLVTLKRNLEDPNDVGDGSRSPTGANGKRDALEEAGGELKDLNKAGCRRGVLEEAEGELKGLVDGRSNAGSQRCCRQLEGPDNGCSKRGVPKKPEAFTRVSEMAAAVARPRRSRRRTRGS